MSSHADYHRSKGDLPAKPPEQNRAAQVNTGATASTSKSTTQSDPEKDSTPVSTDTTSQTATNSATVSATDVSASSNNSSAASEASSANTTANDSVYADDKKKTSSADKKVSIQVSTARSSATYNEISVAGKSQTESAAPAKQVTSSPTTLSTQERMVTTV